MEKKQYVLRNLHRVILIFCITFIVSCSSKEKAKIRIENIDLKGQKAILEEQRVSGIRTLDSVNFSRRGVLKYTFEPKQPTFYTVRIPSGNDIFLLVYPGDKIKVTASSDSLVITGSPESIKLNTLYDSLFATRKILEDIRTKYFASEIQQAKDSLNNEYIAVSDNYRRFTVQFVLENMSSLVGLAALYQQTVQGEYVLNRLKDLQYFKLVTDSLTKRFPKHQHVKQLQNNFKLMYESYQLERLKATAKNVAIGIPDLNLPTITGDSVTLLSLKNSYVLLNFWDNNSQKDINFPYLKSISEKYQRKGFSIYNVYVGRSYDTWKRIVKFEDIGSWINVADTSYPYSRSRMSYNVNVLPSNYLIDLKEKNILKKDLNARELEEFLSQTMK